MKKINMPIISVNEPFIEIYGNRELVISGKTEISELEETVLKIKCDEHRISILGENIKISNCDYNGLSLKGNFSKIEFEKGE